MKLKIIITGPRVHGVGYRVLLGKIAMSLAIPGLTAYNWEDDKVIALVEGDPERIEAFRRQLEGKKPVLAEVTSIISEDYTGEVGRTSEYAMSLTFEQFETAIPILYRIAENTALIPEIAKTTKAALEEIKGLREDIQPGFAMQIQQIQTDVKAIKARLGMS